MSVYQDAKQITVDGDILHELAHAFGEEYRRYTGITYCMKFGREIPRLKIMWSVVRRDAQTDAAAHEMMRRIFRAYFFRVAQWRRDGYAHEPSVCNLFERYNGIRMDIAEYDRERQRRRESEEYEQAARVLAEAQILRDIQE